MKKILLSVMTLMVISSAHAQSQKRGSFLDRIFGKKTQKLTQTIQTDSNLDSIAITMSPKFYKKRTEAVFNIGLINYGELYTDEQLEAIQNLLEDRFEQATNSLIKVNVLFRAILPYKHQIKDYPTYTQPHVTEIERLQRLWYYDNKNMSVINEVYTTAKSHDLYGKDFSKLDGLAIITGAQFDGLAFAAGRLAIIENPTESAWNLEGGGQSELLSNERVVDGLIHELGHTLYLGHASDQCFGKGVSYEDTLACCAQSENKNDVLSYCRSRASVNENFFYKFEECNLKNIENNVVPAMLSGGAWIQTNNTKCL